MKLLHLLIFSLTFLGSMYCSRILVLYPFGTLSHKLSLYPVVEALGAKGHNVTIVTGFAPKQKFKNVREIVIPLQFNENDFKLFFEFRKAPIAITQTIGFFKISEVGEELFHQLMANSEFQQILKNKEADLVLVDSIFNDFCMPIIDSLNVPFIFVSSSCPLPWHSHGLGGSMNLAITPGEMSAYTTEMSFLQRVNNVFLHYYLVLSRNLILIPKIESYTRLYFPNYTSILDIERKASLFITSRNPSYSWPRSFPPDVIEIGPVHCREPKLLPQNLKRIADESSEHGFIVFSLGSTITSSAMPKRCSETMLRVFAKIPQKVIWRWETDIENVPSNVQLVKWLPQQDLLGHPSARLFLSHGGLLGIQEAIYHGVPLLGLPIANDQYGNIGKLVHEGMALQLDWDELTDELLYDAITTLINNSTWYKANAERLSSIMRDTPMSGIEKAVYWMEYVLRHNGTAHLKLNTNLSWYQDSLIDVLAFLLACVCCSLFASIFACRKILRSRKERKHDEQKKNK